MEPILGIDLGTTNSEVALLRDGQPVVFAEDGDPILPSFVGLSADGKLLVGKAARNQWVLAPDRTIKSIKRRMGEDVKVKLGDQEYRPQEISAMILRALRDRAAKQLGAAVTKAVITVPAYFNDAQRQATREAGELAGLDVVRILNEPTSAASLVYDPNRARRERARLLARTTWGAARSDVLHCPQRTREGVVEVLARHGDTQASRRRRLRRACSRATFCDEFQEKHGIDLRANLAQKARVLRAVEEAKKTLSSHPFARIEEEFIAEKNSQALHFLWSMDISRHTYEALIQPLLDRDHGLPQAGPRGCQPWRRRRSTQVVLVGEVQHARTPLISALLEERLKQPAHQEVNPELCVAMGAALQAGIIAGESVAAVLVDITPHTLGIKAIGIHGGMEIPDHFAPIIRRNTALPASRSELFYTAADDQETVEIDVYQGESPDVRHNARVGRFVVQGLAPVPSGNAIVVQLDLNLDGVLRVTARERATGLQKQVTIENALAKFQRDERDAARGRLEDLWDDADTAGATIAAGAEEDEAEDDDYGEALAAMPEQAPCQADTRRENVQARALLEKAERLLATVPAEDRPELQRLMANLSQAVADGNAERRHQASNSLADVLFYLEDVG